MGRKSLLVLAEMAVNPADKITNNIKSCLFGWKI
jgi:hypothetical protein